MADNNGNGNGNGNGHINAIPGDLDLLRAWFPFIRRLRKEHGGQGVTIVKASLILDPHGNPVLWLEPESAHLEPGARAEETLKGLVEGLVG